MKISRRSFLGTSGAGVAAATALPALEVALGDDANAQTLATSTTRRSAASARRAN
jgi:hypothetical protein